MEIKRKGIIFALDAALAVSVVIIILINSSYYFSTSSKESLSQLQPVRIGSDIMALLDFSGDINSAILQDSEDDGDTIPQANLNVSAYLPKNYAMKYAITDMKETRTIDSGDSTYCPPDGGENDNCKTDTDVRCDEFGCTLDQDEWLKIKPITEPTQQANIINQGEHFVIVSTDQSTVTLPTLNLKVAHFDESNDQNLTNSSSIFDKDIGSYFYYFAATNPLRLPYFEAGPSDNNWIILENTGTTPIQIKWVRIAGDESYSRSAFSSGESSIPQDRFIGTGERFVTVVESDGDFEGYHLVRYWIWLKTAGGS